MRLALRFILLLVLCASTARSQDNSTILQRIAFGSCSKDDRPQPLWKPITECSPNLWVWLGDIVYGRADDLAGLAKKYQREKEQPEYTTLRQRCGIIGMWDDNDYGVSDGGRENPNKTECQRLLLDFLDEPADSARRKQAGVYAAYTFGVAGSRVKIILLDGRYFREKPGRASDMLGADQWQWLEQQLINSDADVHLIGSGIQVLSSDHPFEKWADFPQSRRRLFDLLAKTQPRNVIFLSGDRHFGEISRLTDARLRSPIYDITSSGMTHHASDTFWHSFSHERNQYRVGQPYIGLNFGLLQFDWNAEPRTVTLQIRDANNAVRVEEKASLAGKIEAVSQ